MNTCNNIWCLLGVCYLKAQKYTEASGKLAFVIRNGGDTKYVSLANELMDKNSLKIEKSEKEVIKNNGLKICFIKYFVLGLLCLGGFLFTNFFNFNCIIKGNTTLETYAKNYHVNAEYVAKLDEMAGDAEFTLKASAGQEIYQVIEQFYKKEDIFYSDGFDCVGISYYSNVEDIEIAGRKIDIEETIEIHGKNAYIWKVDNIDLENVDYLDFHYE